MIFSVLALLALAGVAGLALFPDGRLLSGAQMGPDRATLWFLVVCSLVAVLTPSLFARLKASRDASTWALMVAFFVLFHIADRGPRGQLSLTFPFAPDDPVAISYATCLVVIGAIVSSVMWFKKGGPEKAVVMALALVGVLGFGMFHFLGNYFSVGADKTLAPYPMATLLVQLVAYGALALCCRAATENERVRTIALRALPVALTIVALRHQLSPIPAPPEDE